MDISIQGRNVEVSDSLRAAVDDKLSRLVRFLDGMERAEVRFLEERNPRIAEKEVCEVTMHGHGHVVRARATAVDSFAAVDRVVDKLEHRIEKLKGKLAGRTHTRRYAAVESRGSRTGTDLDDPADADGDGDEGHPRIVRTKQFAMKPMTAEEAALQMELLSHDFFLFTNADTSAAAVVYRRKDGHIGLIDSA
jgi:putative sigma-54 modulation protein